MIAYEAVNRIQDLEALLRDALPLVDAYRRVSLGDGDITAMNIRIALGL